MWARTMSCSATRPFRAVSKSRSSSTYTPTRSRSRAIRRSTGRGATTTTSTVRWSTTARILAATATTGARRSVWCTRGTIIIRAVATPGGTGTTAPAGTGAGSATRAITPTRRVMSIQGGRPGGLVRAASPTGTQGARRVVRAEILGARRVGRSPAHDRTRGRKALTRCAQTAGGRRSPQKLARARVGRAWPGGSQRVASPALGPRVGRRARAQCAPGRRSPALGPRVGHREPAPSPRAPIVRSPVVLVGRPAYG